MATTQEGNVSFQQLRKTHRLGDGTQAQSCDGTFTAGNVPEYSDTANDGTLKDSGIPTSDIARITKVQQESYVYAADTGSANAYAVVLSPAPTIVAGSEVVFKAANANTGASTLAVNGGTASPITKNGTSALSGGEIAAGQIITAKYDGTNWQIISPVTSSSATVKSLQFLIPSGAPGTNLLPALISPGAGSFSVCKIEVKSSDAATALTLDIKQNGTSIFSSKPTIAAGTAAGSLVTTGTFTSSPLAIAQDDLFTMDITSGSGSWAFTVILR